MSSKVIDEDLDNVKQRRLWIGGLSQSVSSQELEQRFVSFGKVLSVDIPEDKDGEARGFAYITLETSESKLKKAKAVYASTKWKGMSLKIEEAKPDFKARLKREWDDMIRNPYVKPTKKRKRKPGSAEMAEVQTLVTDENVKERKGWTTSRYNRAVIVFHSRDPVTGKILRLDPAKHKSSLQKLSERVNTDTPIDTLTWEAEQEVEELYRQRELQREERRKEFMKLMEEYAKQFPTIVKKKIVKPPAPPKLVAGKPLPPGVISFEDEEEVVVPQRVVSFDSDSEVDGDEAISGCPKGYENAKVDYDSDDSAPIHEPGSLISEMAPGQNDTVSKVLKNEKQKSLQLLNAMFGKAKEDDAPVAVFDVDVVEPVKPQIEYHSDSDEDMVLNDFEMESEIVDKSDSISTSSSKDTTESSDSNSKEDDDSDKEETNSHHDSNNDSTSRSSLSIDSDSNNQDEKSQNDTNDTHPAPDDSNFLANKDTYQVNTNLRSLIYGHMMPQQSLSSIFNKPQESHFSLSTAFGFQEEEEQAKEQVVPTSDQNVVKALSRNKLFFFHFEDPILSKKMLYREAKYPFTRTKDPQVLVQEWQDSRQELTQEFKRKNKSVKRKRAKLGLK